MSSEPGTSAIRRVAVIGAGTKGRAFALACARAGFSVVLEDVMPSRLRSARLEVEGESGGLQAPVSFVSSVEEAVREADLAIDFVPDELESKLEIFSLLDRMAPPHTILCTPTHALSISDLASCTYRPERCVAIASSGEDLLAGPVTLLRGRATSGRIVEAVFTWLRALTPSLAVGEDDRDPMLTKHLPGPVNTS